MNALRELFASKELFVAPGIYNGLSAKLVEQAGFKLAYASGGAIARSCGLPDLGLISFTQITEVLASITGVTDLPVIADFDNGYGNALNARHAIKAFLRTGVCGVHMEDQSLPKRCGHLSGKRLISAAEMVQKIKAVKDCAGDDFYLIARTDAIAVEGFEAALERAALYIEAGADMIFVEAPTSEEQIQQIGKQLSCPKLLNMFFSGKTPIVPLSDLKKWGYQCVIVPSDLQRASIFAMQNTLSELAKVGNSESLQAQMVSFKQREAIIDTPGYLATAEQFTHCE